MLIKNQLDWVVIGIFPLINFFNIKEIRPVYIDLTKLRVVQIVY